MATSVSQATETPALAIQVKDSVDDSAPVRKFAPEGSLAAFRSLYQGPRDFNDRWTWLDKEPEDVPEAAENEETAQYALITRLQKAQDSRKKFDIHSIIIQSTPLKEALAEILKGYPGVHCDLRRLEFEAPFRPFVHRWAEFEEYRQREHINSTTAQHLTLLYDVLQDDLKDALQANEDYVQHGVVTYEHLWTIFKPGDIVYADSFEGAPAALKLIWAEYVMTMDRGDAYQLNVEDIDYNGRDFYRRSRSVHIYKFSGTRKIANLDALPLSFHPDEKQVREVLTNRGERFEQLAGFHYKEYNGLAVGRARDLREVMKHCTGRIVIDAHGYELFSRHGPQLIDPHHHPGVRDVGVGQLEVELDNDDTNKSGIRKMAEGTYEFGKDVDRRRVRLTSDLHLICRGRVRGFSLNKKEWMEFYLDLVKDVEFNEDAFSSLVLPAEQKEVILSFAESQASGIAFDDVICGKGRGHITLLSGPPGVGKTLTAESVAEHMRVPLYTLSAGDLGIHTLDVENRLNTILDMVARWNAVLLLDECDIYLERRTAQDLERNKLVSIFLRLLEYYEGILFLTTNRIDNIDSAFQSRIHISLSYPELDDGTRRLIWENFLDRLGVRENWSDDDLDELAKMELNGRQIKNVLKSAALLSARKKEGLSRSYVDLVLGIEKRRPGVAPEQELGREWVA